MSASHTIPQGLVKNKLTKTFPGSYTQQGVNICSSVYESIWEINLLHLCGGTKIKFFIQELLSATAKHF